MHGPTCIFWAKLTPCSRKVVEYERRIKQIELMQAKFDQVHCNIEHIEHTYL